MTGRLGGGQCLLEEDEDAIQEMKTLAFFNHPRRKQNSRRKGLPDGARRRSWRNPSDLYFS